MQLGELCEIKKNFPEADFWLSIDGKPRKDYYHQGLIGIKVVKTDTLVPDYLFYVMEYVYRQGLWNKIDLTVENVQTKVVFSPAKSTASSSDTD